MRLLLILLGSLITFSTFDNVIGKSPTKDYKKASKVTAAQIVSAASQSTAKGKGTPETVTAHAVRAPKGKYVGNALLTTITVEVSKTKLSLTLTGMLNKSVENVGFTMKGSEVRLNREDPNLIAFVASFQIPALTVDSLKFTYNPTSHVIEAAILGFTFQASRTL